MPRGRPRAVPDRRDGCPHPVRLSTSGTPGPGRDGAGAGAWLASRGVAADPEDVRAALARLPRVVATPATGVPTPGWVPVPPVLGAERPSDPTGMAALVDRPSHRDVPGDAAPDDDVASDDATSARTAVAAAMVAYTAAHGHPWGAGEGGTPRRVRIAVGVRVAVGAVVALALVVGVVAVRAWQRAPSVSVPSAGSTTGVNGTGDGDGSGAVPGDGAPAGTAGTGSAVGSGSAVVVHVVGEVASPGVVSLQAGARVADAVAAAGGPTGAADLSAINLARVVTDGEQVVVPAPGQAAAGSDAAAGDGQNGSGRVDLNRADAAAFDTLPGIGPVLAERIVAWRDEHGRFTAVEELTEVAGIGPALLSGVRDLVEVG